MAKTVANQGEGKKSYNVANPIDKLNSYTIQRPLKS